MDGYGLSAARFNRFFMEHSSDVCSQMSRAAGPGAAPKLSEEIFRSARSAMAAIPSQELSDELCAKILEQAVAQALSSLSGNRRTVPHASAQHACSDAGNTGPDGQHLSEPQEETQIREQPPLPPSGWLHRVDDISMSAFSPDSGPEQIPFIPQAALAATPPGAIQPGPDERESTGKKPHSAAKAFILAVLIVLVLVLTWALAGVLMSQGLLPRVDLGYSWFNSAVFPFFRGWMVFEQGS